MKSPSFQLCWKLELHGAVVTMDAMGCRTKTAERIVEGGADDAPAAKSNQPTPYDGIDVFFTSNMEDDFAEVEVDRCETNEMGRGRREHRSYFVCAAPADLPDSGRWKGLTAFGAAASETVRIGKTACRVRYDILSRRLSAKEFAAAMRGCRGIESRLHQRLDRSFGEARCRVRKDHGDAIVHVYLPVEKRPSWRSSTKPGSERSSDRLACPRLTSRPYESHPCDRAAPLTLSTGCYVRDARRLRPDLSRLPQVDWEELDRWISEYLSEKDAKPA